MLDGVLRVLLIIELTTDLGKSFHEANLLMILISDDNSFGAQIRDARVRAQVLSPGLIVHRGLKLWLLVHHVSVHQINCHLKLISSKDLSHGMISLNQLSIL